MNDDLSGTVFGNYELVSAIGKGGMAIVYRANQRNIEREVAVKVLYPTITDEDLFRVRFEREVNLIARLQHDRIVPVYDYGEHYGYHYLVMRLLDASLTDVIRGGPLALDLANYYVQQICGALQYAHQQGVVHRDLKPSNILLDRAQNAIYLVDFGLAKLVSDMSITDMGKALLGTPAYMAPEMWQASTVGVQTDIYSLGVTVYEMLSGKPPFSSPTIAGLMYSHLHASPPDITQSIEHIPQGVQEVLEKALSKSPEDRFSSAAEFATQFQQAIAPNGEVPTPLAKPSFPTVPIPELARKKRAGRPRIEPDSPTVMVSHHPRKRSFVASLVVLILAIGLGWVVLDPMAQKQKEEKSTDVGTPTVDPTDAPINVAEVPSSSDEAVGSTDPINHYVGGRVGLNVMAVAADGQRIALTGLGGTIYLWNIDEPAEPALSWSAHSDTINSLAWSPDGQQLASAGDDRVIKIWNLDGEDPELIVSLEGHPSPIREVTWRDDNTELVSGGTDGRLFRWQIQNNWGRVGPELTSGVIDLDWRPNQDQVALANDGFAVRVWDLGTNVISLMSTETSNVRMVDWNPTGDDLAFITEAGKVSLLVPNQAETIVANRLGVPMAVEYSPNGERLAVAYENQVRIWNAIDYTLLGHLTPSESASLVTLAWSPDSQKLFSSTKAGDILEWSLPDFVPIQFAEENELPAQQGAVVHVVWNAAGDQLASLGDDGSLKIWDVGSGKPTATLNAERTEQIAAFAWSFADPNLIVTGGCDSQLIIWNIEQEAVQARFGEHRKCITRLVFHAKDNTLLGADENGTLRIWNVDNQQAVSNPISAHPQPVRDVVLSRDGTRIATVGDEGSLRVRDFADNQVTEPLSAQANSFSLLAVDWGQDDEWLVTGGVDAVVRLWKYPFTSNQNEALLAHQGVVTGVAWTPVGNLVASIDEDGCLALWAMQTSEKLFMTCDHSLSYRSLAWHPEGEILAIGSSDGKLKFWKLP